MPWNIALFLGLFFVGLVASDVCVTIEDEEAGQWTGSVTLGPVTETITQWTVVLGFDSASVDWVESVVGEVSGAGATWSLASKEWDGELSPGDSLQIKFIVGYSANRPEIETVTYVTESCAGAVSVVEEAEGEWTGAVEISNTGAEPIHGWTLQLVFSAAVDYLDCVVGTVTGSGTFWVIQSKDWDADIPAGGHLDVPFIVFHGQDVRPSVINLNLNGEEVCGGGEVCYNGYVPGPSCDGDYTMESDTGTMVTVEVDIVVTEAVSSWAVDVHFESDVTDLTSPLAEVEGSGDSWRLTNKQFDGDLTPGTLFPLRFAAYYSGETPKIDGLVFNDDVNLCDAGDKVRRSEDLFGGSPLVSSSPPWDSEGHHIQPGGLWGDMVRPFPTNVWWQNMVNDADNGGMINTVNPYIVKVKEDGLHVCLPTLTVTPSFVLTGFLDNLIMTSQEGLGSHVATKYDDLSVTMTWDNGAEAPIVRGMPYATLLYTELTPIMRFGHAITSFEGSGKRYELTLNNEQTWVIYASTDISFTQSGEDLVASGPFTGAVRAAAVWSGKEGDIATLDSHAEKIPVGGTVSAEVAGDTAHMAYNWDTQGSGDLLMMALPHHLDTLTTSQTGHKLSILKGEMVGISGDLWEFTEDLTTISWDSVGSVAEDKVADIKAALEYDITNEQVPGDDPYFGGKKMALFARLSLIADQIGEAELATIARDRVREFIEGWLGGTNPNKLLYEDSWGGVCSSCGLHDEQCDFGNGMYNDHHFHYGYHIYTAAVLARADPAWGEKWNERVLHMISDVAEPSRASAWYPFTRTKDWYDGHAWASGIFAFADGKNQESTSESVNGWYAIYLWGLATDNGRVRDLGRLMTALEIRAAHRYWQMTSEYSAYPAPFSDHKSVGILWSTKVDYATWFGGYVEFIHCIQMLPFTPISEELLRQKWIQEEYPVLSEAYTRPDPPLSEGWKGYVVMAHAVIDPQAAYQEALQLTSYDDGNTKSNTLWWIATRPGAGGGPTPSPGPTPPTTTPGPTTTAVKGCCGPNSFTDPRCLDIPNDPNGGLGCDGCGAMDCRLCGEGPYIPCE